MSAAGRESEIGDRGGDGAAPTLASGSRSSTSVRLRPRSPGPRSPTRPRLPSRGEKVMCVGPSVRSRRPPRGADKTRRASPPLGRSQPEPKLPTSAGYLAAPTPRAATASLAGSPPPVPPLQPRRPLPGVGVGLDLAGQGAKMDGGGGGGGATTALGEPLLARKGRSSGRRTGRGAPGAGWTA